MIAFELCWNEGRVSVTVASHGVCVYVFVALLQCAVRAAVKGRVLILEGIEKAERNVLPVLNNLLENREMQLDDGRFLMAASGYDKLLQVICILCIISVECSSIQFSSSAVS